MVLDKKKVLLGFSGGVDSTASVLLLREQGYEVTGMFLNVFGYDTETQSNAITVAKALDLELIIEDISVNFKKSVMDYFYNEYINGRTPNPCVECNKFIKFPYMLENAKKIGAYYIATGHYVRIFQDDNGMHKIKRGKALDKDQSYMMYNLGQDVLQHVLFPLGDLTSKEETRKIAKEANLPNAGRKDSQDICFIPDDDYKKFIHEEYNYKPVTGEFVDPKGKVLGEHKGLINYTIGQRKGLGIAAGKPMYVLKLDNKANTVVVGENEALFSTMVLSHKNHFCYLDLKDGEELEVEAKIRYAGNPSKAVIVKDKHLIKTVFEEPQRAVTPGQSLVFYDDGGDDAILIGGGTII